MKLMLRVAVLVLCYLYWPLSIVLLAQHAKSFAGVVFFLIFTHSVHLINTVAAHRIREPLAQIPVAVAVVGYIGWSAYIYMQVFHWNTDPQSPIALLFIGVYAVPVVVPLLALAWWRQVAVPSRMKHDVKRSDNQG